MLVIQSQDRPRPAAPGSARGLRSPLVTIDLSASFKAYDVRGIVGESITAETVRATGAAFVDVLGLAGLTVLVGGDMRPSSPEFVDAFAEGAVRRGADVVKIGLISTDELYYASGTFGVHRTSARSHASSREASRLRYSADARWYGRALTSTSSPIAASCCFASRATASGNEKSLV